MPVETGIRDSECRAWIPAFVREYSPLAGMTNRRLRGNDARSVMPVATGIQDSECRAWIPAYVRE
jgi:hypothetical protein